MNIEHEYLRLLQDILDNGVEKSDRTGTGTISVFGRQIRHKMSEGFPLLTTKKMAWKTMVIELLWFLRGDTDIRFLWKNNCSIWDGDWYKHYISTCSSPYSLDEIKKFALAGDTSFHNSTWDLGPIYGKQWRKWTEKSFTDILNRKISYYGNTEAANEMAYEEYQNSKIDQIQNLINELKTNPDSRRLMVNSWNVGQISEMVLPPCHYGFQVYTRELSLNDRILEFTKRGLDPSEFRKGGNYGTVIPKEKTLEVLDNHNIPTRAISLMFNMRSNDVPLGLPFNIASYGLLLEIIGRMVNMVPDELISNLGDAHIYKNQIDGVKEQLTREPMKLPKLKHLKTDDFYKTLSEDLSLISHLDNTDFELVNYQSHPKIKMPLSN